MSHFTILMKTRLQRFSRTGTWHSLGLQVLIATAVLIVAAPILMTITLSNLKQSMIESKATQDTLLQITTIESRLIEFDGALSAYALSGDPWYRPKMKTDKADLHASLNQMKHSLQNDPPQLQRYNALTPLTQK